MVRKLQTLDSAKKQTANVDILMSIATMMAIAKWPKTSINTSLALALWSLARKSWNLTAQSGLFSSDTVALPVIVLSKMNSVALKVTAQ